MHGLLRRHRSLERKIFFLTQFLIGLFVAVSFVNFNETHRLRRAEPDLLGEDVHPAWVGAEEGIR